MRSESSANEHLLSPSRKRLLDLVLAVPAVAVAMPVLALVSLGVAAALDRPVIFAQERPGLRGRTFSLYKFRTMTSERDSAGDQAGRRTAHRVRRRAVNVAVTVPAAFPVMVHGPVPVQLPLHPLKVAPAAAAAVKVTTLPANGWEQATPQLIPAGLLVTVPVPVPALTTVTFSPPAGLAQASSEKSEAPAALTAWTR